MRKGQLGFIIACSLAVAGGAVAGGVAVSNGFHGVNILWAETLIKSNDKGEAETASVKVGPYDRDAVVLYDATSEVRFALNKTDPVRLAGMMSGILEDGVSIDTRRQTGSIWSDHPYEMRDGYGQNRLFLKQGEVKSLAVATQRLGDIDPVRTSISSRLHIVAIAAPN